jgi:hypothetical protein
LLPPLSVKLHEAFAVEQHDASLHLFFESPHPFIAKARKRTKARGPA